MEERPTLEERPISEDGFIFEDRPVFVAIATPYLVLNNGIAIELRAHPDLHVVASTTLPRVLLQVAEVVEPEVFIIDECLSLLSGIDLIARVHEIVPSARILVILASDFRTAMSRAYRAGATGFVTASATLSSVVRGVRALADGMPWLDPCIIRDLSRERRSEAGYSSLLFEECGELLARSSEPVEDPDALLLRSIWTDTRYGPAGRTWWAVGEP